MTHAEKMHAEITADIIMALLTSTPPLTDEQRAEIFGILGTRICIHCGRVTDRCFCTRDD